MNVLKIFSILSVLIFFTACSNKGAHDIATCHCDDCMDIKIGQMIVAGFKGAEPSDEIKRDIQESHVGGIILYDKDVSNEMGERNIRSPKQVADLTTKLRSYTDRDLLIFIDQEGGTLNRLKPEYGFPATSSAAHQGMTGSLDSATHVAATTAKTLVDCGINVNLAPCVDVNVNSKNSIIGLSGRSFSSDPDSVYLFALCWVKELHRLGVIACFKHFPGHGSSQSTTYRGITDITATWSESELIPYKDFIATGYNGIIMAGHLFNRNIDPDHPASLSKKTIDGLLRKKMGFNGVVVFGDINVGVIKDSYSFEDALMLAINAGNNLILLGNNGPVYEEGLVKRCHDIIKAKIAEGTIPAEKIDGSYIKITKLVNEFKNLKDNSQL